MSPRPPHVASRATKCAALPPRIEPAGLRLPGTTGASPVDTETASRTPPTGKMPVVPVVPAKPITLRGTSAAVGFKHLEGVIVGLLVREAEAIELAHISQAAEPPFHLGLQLCQATCHIVTLSSSFIPRLPAADAPRIIFRLLL